MDRVVLGFKDCTYGDRSLSGIYKATEGGRSVFAFVNKLHGCKFGAQLGAGDFAIADVKIPMIIAADDKSQTSQLRGSTKLKMKRDDYVAFDQAPAWHLGYVCPGQ